MKTRMIIEANGASLIVEAETEFEKEMLSHVEKYPQHDVVISTEQSWGTVIKGRLIVSFTSKLTPPV